MCVYYERKKIVTLQWRNPRCTILPRWSRLILPVTGHINIMCLLPQAPSWAVLKSTQQHFCSSLAKSFAFCITTMHNLNFIVRKQGHSLIRSIPTISIPIMKKRKVNKRTEWYSSKSWSHEKLGKTRTIKIGRDKGGTTINVMWDSALEWPGGENTEKKLVKSE